MNKTLIAMAAAALAATFAPAAQAGFAVPSIAANPLVQRAGCDGEDYAEYLEERAEARAEALEDGEGYASRQASAPQSSAEAQRASAEPEKPATSTPKNTADAGDKKDTKTDAKSEVKKADEPKKSDAKSVASADGTCKKYFSSVGMTLSVPCE